MNHLIFTGEKYSQSIVTEKGDKYNYVIKELDKSVDDDYTEFEVTIFNNKKRDSRIVSIEQPFNLLGETWYLN